VIVLDVDGERFPICGGVIALDVDQPSAVLLCAGPADCSTHRGDEPDPRVGTAGVPVRLLCAATDPEETPRA
jgi:hypothetical protein